jgi:glycosyltransferase involved in cell wall biosynthesis
VYRTLLSHPPQGVKFVQPPASHYSEKMSVAHQLKLAAWNAYQRFFPPVAFFDSHGARLIHSTNNIFVANAMPWVMDVESAEALAGFKSGRLGSSLYARFIRKQIGARRCKAVMPWSGACEQAIRNALPYQEVSEKLRVVRPAMPVAGTPRKKSRKSFHLLFVGRVFYEKGGREALAAYDGLKEKYDVQLTMVADVPAVLAAKYHSDRNVSIVPPTLSSEGMDSLYAKADALVFPTYMDTFGAVVLEAMAHGLPVVSTKVYCIPEMVEHGKSGLLVEPPIKWHDENLLYPFHRWPKWENFVSAVRAMDAKPFSAKLAKETEKLILDGTLGRRISSNALSRMKTGPFSIKVRNERLREVYENALSE